MMLKVVQSLRVYQILSKDCVELDGIGIMVTNLIAYLCSFEFLRMLCLCLLLGPKHATDAVVDVTCKLFERR